MALTNLIFSLQEELALLKRQNVSRSLTFGPKFVEEAKQDGENDFNAITLDHDNKVLRVSSKQVIQALNILII